MRITIERLRTSIVILAAILVSAIVLFFAYARYRVRHIGRDLPARLGLEIQQSTNGFTISKSDKGHTFFTLHASKAVQYKGNGRALLHDVSITVFDNNNAPSDRIYGSEFEFDPATATARAMGEVDIDVTMPSAAAGDHGGTPVHVKTSGLVFHQKTGEAETRERLEFASKGQGSKNLRGSAHGASYNATSGVLHLDSDVVFDAVLERGPVSVRARSAEFNRGSRLLTLRGESATMNGQTLGSEVASVLFRPDGTVERMQGHGDVRVDGAAGEAVRAQTAVMEMNAKGEAERATLDGGVQFAATEPDRALAGSAGASTVALGPGGALERLRLIGNAQVMERARTSGVADAMGQNAGSPLRQASAAKMEISFAPGPNARAEARSIVADGNASIREHSVAVAGPVANKSKAHGEDEHETTLAADHLEAALGPGSVLKTLRGTGNTRWSHHTAAGLDQSSRGDTLEVSFAAAGALGATPAKPETGSFHTKLGGRGSRTGSALGANAIAHAVQRGGVEMVQIAPPAHRREPAHGTIPAAQGTSEPVRSVTEPVRSVATAEEAVYDGRSETVRLQGGAPRLSENLSELSAGTIDFNRLTGDVIATGTVRATYRQQQTEAASRPATSQGTANPETAAKAGKSTKPEVAAGGPISSEPLHIAAEKAYLQRATDQLTFSSFGATRTRLWQGAASISAPEIDLSRTRQTLLAHGLLADSKAAAGARPVLAIFPGQEEKHPDAAAARMVRVEAATLLYAAADHKASFTGAVLAQEGDAQLRADTALVFLRTAAAGAPAASRRDAAPTPLTMPSPQGSVERIVAEGNVHVTQADRQGSGVKLVYTAQDGRFLLTGSPGSLPKLTDAAHGTVTGNALIFNNRDGSVMVNGGAVPAITETRVSK